MIEAVSNKNLREVLPLIRAYQKFYKVKEICDEKNFKFFSVFGPTAKEGCQFLYRSNGSVVAFATVYFSFTSTVTSKIGIMNDLYTSPSNRGKGIARQLIEHCKNYALNNGAVRLQWATSLDNLQAQKLYDSMDTIKTTWHFYAYNK